MCSRCGRAWPHARHCHRQRETNSPEERVSKPRREDHRHSPGYGDDLLFEALKHALQDCSFLVVDDSVEREAMLFHNANTFVRIQAYSGEIVAQLQVCPVGAEKLEFILPE